MGKFEEHKNKVIKIILKLIQQFYSDKIKDFNKDEFCKIETEKKIVEKVNKILNNNEYDETFNKKLRLLILDFNSFIVSTLKIYNINKYFNENYLYNLDLFEDIDFPQIFNIDDEQPILIDENIEKYLEKETFKENICSSLRNMIDFEKFLENQDEKRHSIIREYKIKNIKIIDNLENFLVINNNNYCEIYDNNGKLILDRFRPTADDVIVINTNLFFSNLEFCYYFFNIF